MEVILWIGFGVIIAALIGGMTNYLAIKMLFHPRHPIYIKGKKLPLTPGIIPKRKTEIARSLGIIVGEQLVTSKGLMSVIQSPIFVEKAENKLTSWIERYCESERTLKAELLQIVSDDQLAKWRQSFQQMSQSGLEQGLDFVWDHYQIGSKTVEEWLSNIPEQRLEEWKRNAASMILHTLTDELNSIRGEQLIGQAIQHIISNQKGFFGAIAGAMVDTQRLTWRVQDALVDVLTSESTKQHLVKMIDEKLQEWRHIGLDVLVHDFTGKLPLDWLKQNVLRTIDTGRWFDAAMQQPMHQLLGRFKEPLLAKVPSFVGWLLKKAEKELDRLVKVFDLPALVEREINHFPVERVERIILDVSGREFRAITWLGAVLGGVIGLVQSIIYLTFLG